MTDSGGKTQTISDVGEFGLIGLITGRLSEDERVLVGPGDDAALVAVEGPVLVSTDILVEGHHFRRDWSSAADIGRKAVAQNLSDINGMGGRATALTVALAAPPDVAVDWILELAQGMQEEAALVGASIVGGDVSRGDAITVAVTVMGHCEGAPVLRSGARPGDVIAVAGRLGWSAAGFAALSRGFRSPRVVVEAHRRPEPPYAAGPEAKGLGATALVDVSDGLLADLGHVAEASGVLVDVDPTVFEIPEPLQSVGAAVGTDPIAFVLTGGEDHALAATFPPGTALPPAWTVVGAVREGQGVLVGGEPYEGPEGWDHFRR